MTKDHKPFSISLPQYMIDFLRVQITNPSALIQDLISKHVEFDGTVEVKVNIPTSVYSDFLNSGLDIEKFMVEETKKWSKRLESMRTWK
jgi:hypothetical protein